MRRCPRCHRTDVEFYVGSVYACKPCWRAYLRSRYVPRRAPRYNATPLARALGYL